MDAGSLTFGRDGATYCPCALSCSDIEALRGLNLSGTGHRLRSQVSAATAPALAIAQALIGPQARAVRAVMFDKTANDNWALGWHQDRTIAVRNRVEVEGFGPWTVKRGIQHVAPPIGLLNGMATLRLHLDDCDADNAPLRIACGSHLLGRIGATEAASVAGRHDQHECLAKSGDIWAYSTPILHASDRAREPTRRRVLQIDFAACALPQGLEWLGLDD